MVEDEFVIAIDLQHMLEDAGFQVMGPHENVGDSLEHLADADGLPDAAILDVQLDGEDVMMLAEQLRLKNVPIVFHSGHAEPQDLEEKFPGSFFCGKPCSPERLSATLKSALRA